MKIICNGEEKELAAGTTLLGLIRSLDLNPDTVVAEMDGRIVKRDEYDTLVPAEGTVVELVRFVGGG